MSGYALCVWLHIVAACAWVGSMIFFAVVVVPVLRRPEARPYAAILLRQLGVRFRALGWVSLFVLLATGTLNLYYRGIGWAVLANPAFWRVGFGHLVAWKLALVALVIVLTALHDVLIGRSAVRTLAERPGSPDATRIRAFASWLGRATLVVSLAILVLAVLLVRGA
jgi:copper resistance protein D